MRRRRFDTVLWVVALGLAIVGVGCGGDEDEDERPCRPFDKCPPIAPYPVGTSPRNVLGALNRAYEERHIDEYSKLFAPDFVFEFAASDVGMGATPVSWRRTDELDSARRLFSDDRVDRITLEFLIPSPRPAAPSDSLPSIEDIWVVEIEAVDLTVHSRTESGEPLPLRVDGDRAAFFFEETDTVDPESGRRLWHMVRWRDDPDAPGGLGVTGRTANPIRGAVAAVPVGAAAAAAAAAPSDSLHWGTIKYGYE